MNVPFLLLTIVFIVIAAAMVLIILVQRPQGGGLAGAFGGAGGGGSDTVFGGRVGDALTWATVVAFVVYLGLAIGLTLLPAGQETVAAQPDAQISALPDGTTTPQQPGTATGSTGLPQGFPTSPNAPGGSPQNAIPVRIGEDGKIQIDPTRQPTPVPTPPVSTRSTPPAGETAPAATGSDDSAAAGDDEQQSEPE